ncbi:hypothetical protein MMC25_005518 [Agyrium rufum]|nr:hypothetical protein [Agyrium rufum]
MKDVVDNGLESSTIVMDVNKGHISTPHKSTPRRTRRRQFAAAATALLAFAASTPSANAQSCVPLSGSQLCPAFNESSVSPTLTNLYPFLAFVSNVEQFDQQLNQYIMFSYVQTTYQQILGCNNVTLTNTTGYYARYTTSLICNAIVQNSITTCGLSGNATRPLCAESCAQQATSEESITMNPQLCLNPISTFVDEIRADFATCSLPPDSLSQRCILGEQNEPNNCGFSNNLQGLCSYCAASSPNATDSCCVGSNVESRCPGVTLPPIFSMPPLVPSSTSSTAGPSATGNGTIPTNNSSGGSGLSGGQIAGIVVGSVVGALLLAALLVLCCFCIRKRRNRSRNNSVFNQPSPKRNAQPQMAQGNGLQVPPAGRVARMAALEGNSSDEPHRGNPVIESERRRGYGDTSDSDALYGPESRGINRPATSKRRASLSSNSVFGGGLEDATSPESGYNTTNGQYSSPDAVASGQSEQLGSFKDYYSQDHIHPGDKVSVLWAYQPRAGDEFELERGDMLKVVGIWDDGWATGKRISERANDYDARHKMLRDSGVSNVTTKRHDSLESGGEIKAFPLVCVCLPEHWRRTVDGDNEDGPSGPPPGL